MITVGYFWHGLIHGGTTFMYLKYSRPLYIFTNVWKGSYTISASIFVDLRYLPPYSTNKFFSCVVSGPSQWSFHFGEEIVFAWTPEEKMTVGDYRTPSFSMTVHGVIPLCCHGPLAPLAVGDFGTSTVLARYESMRL